MYNAPSRMACRLGAFVISSSSNFAQENSLSNAGEATLRVDACCTEHMHSSSFCISFLSISNTFLLILPSRITCLAIEWRFFLATLRPRPLSDLVSLYTLLDPFLFTRTYNRCKIMVNVGHEPYWHTPLLYACAASLQQQREMTGHVW